MGPTENLQRQHYEILMLAQQIQGLTSGGQTARSATQIRSLLASLAGKLKMHLTIEDNVLYPQLKLHSHDRVRETAAVFSKEMGSLSAAFSDYMQRWTCPLTIAASAHEFAEETNSVFAQLRERIKREEQELYSLF